MIEAIRRAAPILATGVVAIAAGLTGFWVGERTAHAKTANVAVPVQLGRFQALGDGRAIDTKSGKICVLSDETHPLPKGLVLDGSCPQLASEEKP